MRFPLPLTRLALAWLISSVLSFAAPFSIVGSHRSDIIVFEDSSPLFTLQLRAFGPGWTSLHEQSLEGMPAARDGIRVYNDTLRFKKRNSRKPSGVAIDLAHRVKQSAPNSVEIQMELTPDAPLTFGIPDRRDNQRGSVGVVLPTSQALLGGTVEITSSEGVTRHELPAPSGSMNGVSSAKVQTKHGTSFTIQFQPAVEVHRDQGEIRFVAQTDRKVAAGKTVRQSINIVLPASVSFEPENRWIDTSNWFPVNVDNDFSRPSEIGMEDWLEKPAGKHGWLTMDGDRLVFKDGTPFKMWGTNILRGPNGRVDAEYMVEVSAAAARYGINTNRLHAFAKPHDDKWAHMFKLMSLEDSFKFHEGHLDLFDLIFSECKKRGIYTGWSVFYGWFPSKADIEEGRFMNWDEAKTILRQSFPRQGSFYAATAVMPDVQDLIIQWHLKLINHVNKHTGIRYADDPALAFVELQNEENAFLGIRNLERSLANAPTYRQNYYDRFASFLKERYGDQNGLREAWGSDLGSGESLESANITPFPGWFNVAEGKPSRRIADQYHFIYQTQQSYYLKFKQAMREAGYGGLLIGSCWQASDWVGHLYNTYLDSEVGIIDRHNYGRDHLDKPGTGLLSAGFQQVADHVFNFSEWGGNARVGQNISSPIMAFYGMGLQGWDGSQQFAWGYPGALPSAATGINNSTNPFDNLAQYLTLSRSVMRGDVHEGDVAGVRRVSLPQLKEDAYVGFFEEFSLLSNANNKSFAAAVPQESLTVGRVLLEFIDGPVEEPVVDKTAEFIDHANRVVRSNTGQLLWDTSGQGWFSVNTPGTQAVIGNSGEQQHVFENVAFAPQSAYGNLYATALDKDATLANARRILVTAIGRSVPKGTKFDELAYRPIERPHKIGDAPLLLEPVRARVSLKRSGPVRVTPLDQNGRRIQRTIPVQGGEQSISFEINTADTQSVFFLVEFD